MKVKLNITALNIWIAENGGSSAKELICKESGLTLSSLNRILGHKSQSKPRFKTRYFIWKITGVSIYELDDFLAGQNKQAS